MLLSSRNLLRFLAASFGSLLVLAGFGALIGSIFRAPRVGAALAALLGFPLIQILHIRRLKARLTKPSLPV